MILPFRVYLDWNSSDSNQVDNIVCPSLAIRESPESCEFEDWASTLGVIYKNRHTVSVFWSSSHPSVERNNAQKAILQIVEGLIRLWVNELQFIAPISVQISVWGFGLTKSINSFKHRNCSIGFNCHKKNHFDYQYWQQFRIGSCSMGFSSCPHNHFCLSCCQKLATVDIQSSTQFCSIIFSSIFAVNPYKVGITKTYISAFALSSSHGPPQNYNLKIAKTAALHSRKAPHLVAYKNLFDWINLSHQSQGNKWSNSSKILSGWLNLSAGNTDNNIAHLIYQKHPWLFGSIP